VATNRRKLADRHKHPHVAASQVSRPPVIGVEDLGRLGRSASERPPKPAREPRPEPVRERAPLSAAVHPHVYALSHDELAAIPAHMRELGARHG
jgi:hypothetical protein